MTGANPFFMGAFLKQQRIQCREKAGIPNGNNYRWRWSCKNVFLLFLGKRQGVLHHSDNVFVSSMARAPSSNQHDCGFRGLDPHRPTVPRASLGTKHIHLWPKVVRSTQRHQKIGWRMDHRRERNLLQSGTEYELVRSDFLMSNGLISSTMTIDHFAFFGNQLQVTWDVISGSH